MGVMPEMEPLCTCDESWRRNEIFHLGLMRWWCPEHRIVTPDTHGKRIASRDVFVPRQPRTLEYPHHDPAVRTKQLKLLGD